MSAGVDEEHEDEKEHEEKVDPYDGDQIVFTHCIEGLVVFSGVEFFEELAEDVEHAEEDGEFVAEGLLEIHYPSVEYDYIVQTDRVGGHSGQIYEVLPDSVLVPVRNGEDEEGEGDERLHDS